MFRMDFFEIVDSIWNQSLLYFYYCISFAAFHWFFVLNRDNFLDCSVMLGQRQSLISQKRKELFSLFKYSNLKDGFNDALLS